MSLPLPGKKADHYLHYLCIELPTRAVGSQGNRAATRFFADRLAEAGFYVELSDFDCMDWTGEGASLSVGEDQFQVQVSPFSLSCQVEAPLVAASDLTELRAAAAYQKILLLHDEIAGEQLLPKNFPFFKIEAHQQIIRLLEEKNPVAIVTATTRDPEMAGGLYPFPLIEDGDFDIPSVFMTAEEGEKLSKHIGETTTLTISASRKPAKGFNVSGKKGDEKKPRIVFSAHIDSKSGSPGALDNASGIVTLLLLAELLKDYKGTLPIELVAINGEDHYSNPGEVLYLAQNPDLRNRVVLNINIDGVGYSQRLSSYSLYSCPKSMASLIRDTFVESGGMTEGEHWYQGDHMIFVQDKVPALAVTSENATEILASICHTPADSPDLVDTSRLVDLSEALFKLVYRLESVFTKTA